MTKRVLISLKMLFAVFGLVALCPGLYFLHLVTNSKPEDTLYYFSTANGRNLHTYVVSMSLIILTFALLCLCFSRLLSRRRSHEATILPLGWGTVLLLILLSISSFLLYDLFLNNEDKFAGYAVKFPLWFSIPVVALLVLFIYFRSICEKDSAHKKYALFVLYTILAFLNAVKYAHINTFSSGYAFYHCNAVTQTIYNVHHNTPFNELTSGIYGHYALFFKPFTMIFGANPISIGVMMGVIGFFATFIAIMTMHLIVKPDVLKAVSAIALSLYMNVITETYWQTLPLRWIFPSIILFMATVYEKKKLNVSTLKGCLLGFFVCSLAILWETETGFFVAIVWSVYCILRFFQVRPFKLRDAIKLIFVHIVAFISEILFAMILMNIYNVSVGGTIEKRAFFFPLLSDFAGVLQTELKFGNMYYVYAISICMCCLLWAFVQVFYWKAQSKYVCSVAAISLMGFAMLTFYMNRTLAGCGNAYLQIIMCNCVLANASIKPLRDFICERKSTLYDISKISVGVIPIATLAITVLLSSYTFVKAEERFARKDYDVTELYALAKEVKEVVPANSYALGFGTSDIYGLLGWDTKYHMRDFADLCSGGKGDEIMNEIKRELAKQNDVFVGAGEYSWLSADFELVREFYLYGQAYTYGYFRRENIT